jgi:hypothetical protein
MGRTDSSADVGCIHTCLQLRRSVHPPMQANGTAAHQAAQPTAEQLEGFHAAVYSAQPYVRQYLQAPLEKALGAEHVRVSLQDCSPGPLLRRPVGIAKVPPVLYHLEAILPGKAASHTDGASALSLPGCFC